MTIYDFIFGGIFILFVIGVTISFCFVDLSELLGIKSTLKEHALLDEWNKNRK